MHTLFYDAAILPTITLLGKDNSLLPHRNIRRVSEDYIFYFITNGTLHFSEDGREYTLKKGDTFLFEPGLLHYGTEDSCYQLYYIHFRHPHISVDRPSFPECVPIAKQMSFEDDVHFLKLCQSFERIAEQRGSMLEGSSVLTACAADEFFIELARRSAFRQEGGSTRGGGGYARISEVIAYLNRHYASPLSSDKIEKDLSYNFDYLNQLFRRHLGTTVFRMLEDIRMENAQRLLLTSNMPLTQIAKEVGYREESYFSKVFKKSTGLSPSDYRSRALKMD